MPNVALSTSWADRFARPRAFFAAGFQIGVSAFEITSLAGAAFYDEICPGDYDIRSLHDPAPGGMSPGQMKRRDILLTSLDAESRALAVAAAKNSVDVSARYGARAVVLHLGQTEADPAPQNRLEELATQGEGDGAEARAIRARMASQRTRRHEQRMAALMRSLDELIPYAAARHIRLGVENRRHVPSVPDFDELQFLLAHYTDDTIGYWHDVGHAETVARAGFTPHADWLRAFGQRLVGMHLHDVIGFDDHRAPGTGCIDWQGLGALLPANGLRTVELDPSVTPAEAQAGIAHLAAAGWI